MTEKKKGKSSKVDRHVGARLRQRRELNGMSQELLAEQIGVSFQQLQKYETGVNRISAGRLYAIAKALKVSTEFFYLGLKIEDLP